MASKIHHISETDWTHAHPRAFLQKNFPDEVPGEETNILKHTHDLGCGAKVTVYAYGDHVFVDNTETDQPYGHGLWNTNDWQFRDLKIQVIETEKPFLAIDILGKAHTKTGEVKRWRKNHHSLYSHPEEYTITDVLSYVIGYNNTDGCYNPRGNEIYEPLRYLDLRFVLNTGEARDLELGFLRPKFGHVDLSKSTPEEFHVDLMFHGLQVEWKEKVTAQEEEWTNFCCALRNFTFDDVNKAWEIWLEPQVGSVDTKSIGSIEKKKNIATNLEKLKEEKKYLYYFYQWLHGSKVNKGVSNNQLLAAWLKTVGEDYSKIVEGLEKVITNAHVDLSDQKYPYHEPIPSKKDLCLRFDEAAEKDREKRENKEWYLRKTNAEKADGLGCTEASYPLTHAAIAAGELPLNVFHDPNDKLKAVNTEWALWEKAFQREGWKDVLCSIATDASRRTTYEKDITPYITFLFKIEKYLDRHAPRPKPSKRTKNKIGWKAMPKYVESQWDLEMEAADENGTVKRRSALTPLPDNEKGIIEVPYAAIAIHGRQTTYCYSQYYILFEEGTLDYETDTPVVNELEEKLNGRDDYGLMYYTLTGSPTNRGYPTFLTIFERRSDYTHVHFHRVHPNKYKDGRPVPACRLVEECYRYMAGNVRAEEIHSQQGDMIFIRCEEPQKWDESEMKGITEFESHAFVVPEGKPPVMLLENKSKSIKNRLGHILAKDDFVVAHPEHEYLTNMPSGWYEVRRCKSWEANPTAVWSFTID